LENGSSQDDGVYVLLKEVMDNALDEYMMGYGRKLMSPLMAKRSEFVIMAGEYLLEKFLMLSPK